MTVFPLKLVGLGFQNIAHSSKACPEGGGSGVLTPLFLDPPPLHLSPPPSTQPDLTDKCNVNCFLIV